MEKSHFWGDWWFFMWFLVILLVGTGEPPPYCNENTLGKIESKFGIGRPPPPQLGQKTKFFQWVYLKAPLILPNAQEQVWKSQNTSNCHVLYNNRTVMDWSNKLGKWNRLMYEAAADSFSCNASAANFWLQSQTQKKVSSHFLPASFKTWMGKGSLFVASLNISHRSREEYPPFVEPVFVWFGRIAELISSWALRILDLKRFSIESVQMCSCRLWGSTHC